MNNSRANRQKNTFWAGALDIIPLCIAVLPWGILAGSMAIQAGMSFMQSVGMSALVFAGAAQLVSLGMLKAGVGLFTILVSVFFITSQHFLYALTLRSRVAPLPAKWRVVLGFLLTDELFALTGSQKESEFNRQYAFGAGLTFYLFWLLFSVIGIVAANAIPNLAEYHLDFSIVATFIAIVVPMIKNRATLACVCSSILFTTFFTLFNVEGAIIISGLLAMGVGMLTTRIIRKKP